MAGVRGKGEEANERAVKTVILHCDHPFLSTVRPRIGDTVWCHSCRDYSYYGKSANIRQPGYRNNGVVAGKR